MIYTTSMVVVQHYFEKKRAMASGIAVAGSGAGTMAFGFITRILLDHLGLRSALLIDAAIVLVVGVSCGLLFRPLANGRGANSSDTSKSDENKSLLGPEGERTTKGEKSNWTLDVPTPQEIRPALYGAISPKHSPAPESCSEKESNGNDGNTLTAILKNPIFLIYSYTLLMFCLGYHVPYTFTPERAEASFHLSSAKSSLLVSIIGLSNIGGRLVFGWVADRGPLVRFWMFGIVLFLNGLSTALVFLYTTYPLMVAYSVMFGAFSGE